MTPISNHQSLDSLREILRSADIQNIFSESDPVSRVRGKLSRTYQMMLDVEQDMGIKSIKGPLLRLLNERRRELHSQFDKLRDDKEVRHRKS
jgi:hypothetical protein